MINIKKTVGRLPKNVGDDTDFSYLSDLSAVHWRVAVFYEYARDSDELREIISAMRRERVFESEWDGAPGELGQKLAKIESVLPPDHLLILHDCQGFPEKPFRDARHDLDILKYFNSVGVESVAAIPWKALVSLRSAVGSQGLSELEYWTKYWTDNARARTLNAISIPWNYTNAELTESFAKLLSRIRPQNCHEPRRAGRKGRCSSSGATDILNQLIAFRLRRAGLSFDQARRLVVYTTEKGWNNAAAAAQERIRHMIVRPLFNS
jgi:hypothetical protein